MEIDEEKVSVDKDEISRAPRQKGGHDGKLLS
jgi:hypothetical protein